MSISDKFKIMQNDTGFFVAERVPINNFYECSIFVWRQITKTYRYHAYVRKLLIAINRKYAAKYGI